MTLALASKFPVWVEFWDPSEPHGHLLLIKSPDESISMQSLLAEMEGFAGELADMFHDCGEQAHGKGMKHSVDVVKKAYEAAIFQLLTTDYQMEWEESQRKQRVYKLWGGQVPALIIQPTMEDFRAWEAIVPDKEGRPWIYGIRKNVLEDILDPREFGAKPNRQGLGGWTIPKEGK